jgi:hypothetical protein
MARMIEIDELYVMARRALIDALDALGPHRDAIVLVGAQAVYLRVGEADLAVAPFTTDGDLVIDPAVLAEIPPLEQALMRASNRRPGARSASGSRSARPASRSTRRSPSTSSSPRRSARAPVAVRRGSPDTTRMRRASSGVSKGPSSMRM